MGSLLRAVLLAAVLMLFTSTLVRADGTYASQLPPSAVIPGTYTVATLPDPTVNQARYAFVSDLGGGAGMVVSDGVNWKHIGQGVVTAVPISGAVTVTPLVSPPIMQFSGSGFVGTSTVTLAASNLYPGYTMRIIVPSGVLSTVTGLLGSLGVTAQGGSILPVAAGTWEDLQWNGTALVEIAKGML